MLQMLLLTCNAQLVEMISLFFANHRQNMCRPEEEVITCVWRWHRSLYCPKSATTASASLMKRGRTRSWTSTFRTVRVREASVSPSVGSVSSCVLIKVLNVIRMRWQWQRGKWLLSCIDNLLMLLLLLVRWILRGKLSVKVVDTAEFVWITLWLYWRICWWTVVVVVVVRTWYLRFDIVVLFKVSQTILSQSKIVLVMKVEVWMFLLKSNHQF